VYLAQSESRWRSFRIMGTGSNLKKDLSSKDARFLLGQFSPFFTFMIRELIPDMVYSQT